MGLPFVASAKNGPAIRSFSEEWIPDEDPDLNWFNQERDPTGAEPECYDQSPDWRPVEIPLGDGRTLVLEDS
jgi:hypothetical protein